MCSTVVWGRGPLVLCRGVVLVLFRCGAVVWLVWWCGEVSFYIVGLCGVVCYFALLWE